ncbi:hypothetical protein BH11PSE5_BH11PSE5_11170 [soil metagenome]|jgi:hypothetical protein|nr:hypothetical protein Sbs19_11220 [Sphingobium sp. BS19]CAH0351910.1 hypothetical protein SPH9361_01675 [Sphingobium sp. CECT 9361]
MKAYLAVAIVCSVLPSVAFADAPPAKQRIDRKAPNYVRCVSVLETGSLVKRHKTCKTNAEWDRVDTGQQREADDLINRARGAITTSGT